MSKKLNEMPKASSGEKTYGINQWWKNSKRGLMSVVYWSQRQLPPSNKSAYNKEYIKIVNQLQKRNPAPDAIFKKKLKEATLQEKGKGLWHNIHAKRKRGERPAKPGEKGYPKTLDINTTTNAQGQKAPKRLSGLLDNFLQETNDPGKLKEAIRKIYEKLVFYRDNQDRIRRFDTDKSKNNKLRK
jgi:hypothetical protein